MKRIGIIGAGRFGLALAESLSNAGLEVILIDRNRPAMQNASEFAIGSNIEASMMATANCKELGIPNVVSKATSELHGKILRRIGADSVIYPDRDSANRLARAIANHNVVDFLEVSDGYSIAEIPVPPDTAGKSLAESNFRVTTGLSVLCVRRANEDPSKPRKVIIPQAKDVLRLDDKLIVFGETTKLDELS